MSRASTIEMAEAVWEYSNGFIRTEAKRDVWLCKTLFFIEQDWLDDAWEEAQRFVNTTEAVSGAALYDLELVAAQTRASQLSDAQRSKLDAIERLPAGRSNR